MPPPSITSPEYSAFEEAYDFFNAALFDSMLPNLLITLQRKANTLGYFSPTRFAHRDSEYTTHELAMNPDGFHGRPDREIMSTLVHEMVHVWQETHGRPSRRGHHNKEWGRKMKQIGLYPSSTGQPGGAETGQKMSHYIIEAGRFAGSYRSLAEQGLKFNWQSAPSSPAAKKKVESKTKYSCNRCGANAWAKPRTSLYCGSCFENHQAMKLMAPPMVGP